MKKILLSSLFFAVMLTTYAQPDEYNRMPYIHGDILIMIDNNDNIQDIVSAHRNVNGVMTELELVKAASEPANIWLLHFNHHNISHVKMIEEMYTDPHVIIAQNNHVVSERSTVPNDPSYTTCWYHDDGATDNDIDSDLAWDITTGGQTANGDDIVVCVIEGGGSQWQHVDLIANHWTNAIEAAGTNGVDDDGNGYVDDIDGWNSGNNTDNIAAGGHGTGVSSMIGAVGNNGAGVVGANWNIKIMQVDMAGSLTESNVIAAYTYPLVMRKMYTSSGGTEGAFVVATNASWGINQGDPNAAPLWCAFYDTLGYHGILNMGATANEDWNIDAVGDLPTACGSDYMISVTATNNNDVRTFSGYGQTTIDLGAPGQNVYMAYGSGTTGYQTVSGTSFASPITAGVAGLLYSVPCATYLADLAMTNPKAAADSVRNAILNGVDPVSNLTTECVTGGRLNAYNSVLIIQNNCTTCTGTFSAAGTDPLCFGDCDGEIAFSASGGSGSYQYSFDGGVTWVSNATETGLCSGNYTVMVDDGADCQYNTSISLTTPSQINIVSSTTDEIAGNDGSINLTVSGGTSPYSYAWTGPNGFTSSSEDPSGLESGTYNVTVTDVNGCVVASSNILVKSQLGIGEGVIEFSVYPNPAGDEITINLTNEKNVTLTLIDNAGRIVKETMVTDSSTTVCISGVSAGIYTLKLITSQGQISMTKLVIE